MTEAGRSFLVTLGLREASVRMGGSGGGEVGGLIIRALLKEALLVAAAETDLFEGSLDGSRLFTASFTSDLFGSLLYLEPRVFEK